MPYLASAFKRTTTLALPALANYKKWIKLGSFYHAVILWCEELNHTPHLAFAQAPSMNQKSPNKDTLISHRQEYKATLQQADVSLATLAKAQTNLLTSLAICRKDTREVKACLCPCLSRCDSPSPGLRMPLWVLPWLHCRHSQTVCPPLQRDRKGRPLVRLTTQAAPWTRSLCRRMVTGGPWLKSSSTRWRG